MSGFTSQALCVFALLTAVSKYILETSQPGVLETYAPLPIGKAVKVNLNVLCKKIQITVTLKLIKLPTVIM